MEQWRDIPEWEGCIKHPTKDGFDPLTGLYNIQRNGPTTRKGRILQSSPYPPSGYFAVSLSREGISRTELVHRLVAITWIGPCPNGQQVRHGPNGLTDNSVDNLCYGTSSQDGLDKRRDGTHGGKAVRRSDGAEFINMHVAAEKSNCKPQSICAVCQGKRKSTGGYGWEYV